MAMNGTLAKARSSAPAKTGKPKSIKDCIKSMESQIALALPKVLTPERFTRIVLTAVSNNPQLETCTQASFLGAMMNAAQLGLEPNTPLGQAYLIPYRNGRTGLTECQFQIGYKGLIDLAYRSGEVVLIQAHEVCENDEFSYEFGLEPDIKHKPAAGERGDVTHYYAVWKGKNGGFGFEVMTKADVEAHRRKYSKARNSPWESSFDAMAKKTVLKKVLKYAPVKVDFSMDETIVTHVDDNAIPTTFEVISDTDEFEQDEADTADTAQQTENSYDVDTDTGEVKLA